MDCYKVKVKKVGSHYTYDTDRNPMDCSPDGYLYIVADGGYGDIAGVVDHDHILGVERVGVGYAYVPAHTIIPEPKKRHTQCEAGALFEAAFKTGPKRTTPEVVMHQPEPPCDMEF